MEVSFKDAPLKPRSILVIGGGPTGLVALRNLIERGQFERVELVERRDDVGGAWYLDNTSSQPPRWPSPAYPGLVGNVLPEFLSFSGHPFPLPPTTPDQPFPTLVETHAYLRSFAQKYLDSGVIRLNLEVIRVEELPEKVGWNIVYRDWSDAARAEGRLGEERAEHWDAVMVSTGWYDTPVWPETEGLDVLREKGLAKHAKWWRSPQGYEGKRVLVIGNANSSNDMAAQLAKVVQAPVYQSIRRPAFPGFPSLPDERIVMVAPVAKYTPREDKFDALLTDGTEIKDLEAVQLGTGYRPNTDFIHVLDNTPGHHPLEATHHLNHFRVPDLHRFILYANNPSLAFIGAVLAYTPYTVYDVASTWLALAWTGEVSYPSTPEGRLAFERERLNTMEKRRNGMDNPSSLMVHSVLGDFEQTYTSELKEDIVSARPELDELLPDWNDERTKVREAMFTTKLEALKYLRDCGRADD